ncbi:hypothetical protein UT300003_32410 [Clostridium sardiniense]
MNNQKDLKSSILIDSKVISNLEIEKKLICNFITNNKSRLKYIKFMNNEIKQKVESLEEKIEELES